MRRKRLTKTGRKLELEIKKRFKDTHPNYSSNVYRKKKLKVVEHYSNGKNCCECCGEKEIIFLSIDHIDGGGGKHRKKVGHNMVHWIYKNNFPSGFRILCHNCNMAIGRHGYCPHKEVREFIIK